MGFAPAAPAQGSVLRACAVLLLLDALKQGAQQLEPIVARIVGAQHRTTSARSTMNWSSATAYMRQAWTVGFTQLR